MPKKESPLFKLIEPKAFEKAEKLLKEGRVAVDAENADGLTALHVAIQKGNAQLVQLLLHIRIHRERSFAFDRERSFA